MICLDALCRESIGTTSGPDRRDGGSKKEDNINWLLIHELIGNHRKIIGHFLFAGLVLTFLVIY